MFMYIHHKPKAAGRRYIFRIHVTNENKTTKKLKNIFFFWYWLIIQIFKSHAQMPTLRLEDSNRGTPVTNHYYEGKIDID